MVLTINSLTPDPLGETNTLLRILISQGVNGTLTAANLNPSPFVPDSRSIRSNCLLLASLCCSLLCAFLWIATKNIVEREGLGPTGRTPIVVLPGYMLTAGLAIFYIGLADYLWGINRYMAWTLIGFTAFGGAIWVPPGCFLGFRKSAERRRKRWRRKMARQGPYHPLGPLEGGSAK